MGEDAAIKETILNLLTTAHLRLTPSDLERAVCCLIISAQRSDIRKAVRELVSLGKITYTQHLSTTHLELNFNRPVQISDRIVLSPSRISGPIDPDHIIIKLHDGTAFGGGDHPTTRMVLQGLDSLLQRKETKNTFTVKRALDIGTGTGVLSIAAAELGIPRVDAVDIDPAACHEAEQNVKLNGVEDRVYISQKSPSQLSKDKYDLVLANLRPPTIMQMVPMMTELSSSLSIWIISGCRLGERERLIKKLPPIFSNVMWKAELTGWAAFAVMGGMSKK